ncbi:MAG: carboxypeptidase-like regulatory domain-containing protein [Bacteroidota bacterium]
MRVPALLYGLLLLTAIGCETKIIDPDLYGNIDGVVINGESQTPMSGVSIETAPATEVLITESEGRFTLEEVSAGSYQIKASKPGYKSKSVTVMVREDRTVTAKIMLEQEEEDDDSTNYLQSEITNWNQLGEEDSSSVEVEYYVTNTSSSVSISEFELYFDIHTNQRVFNYEITNTQLDPGEKNYGSFRKFVKEAVVDSVIISDTWYKEEAPI